VVTTLMARGAFPDSHAQHLGMPGMHGTVPAVLAIQESDLLVSLGARFDDRVTGKASEFAPDAKVVHVDIDPAEISKIRTADVPIVGDAKDVIIDLTSAFMIANRAGQARPRPSGGRDSTRCVGSTRSATTSLMTACCRRSTSSSASAPSRARRASTPPASANTRCGRPSSSSTSAPTRGSTRVGAGTMGYGVPAAMGAKVANPDRTVWAIDGDGCFQMTNQELATCTINEIPIKVAIINNSSLGMVRQWQTLFYNGRHSFTDLNTGHDTVMVPDFVKLAEAYGALAIRVTKKEEVDAAIKPRQRDQRPPGGDRLHREPRRHGVADGAPGRRQLVRPVRPRTTPPSGKRSSAMSHVLSLLVEDKPGLLTRVAGLFARRGFNIEILAVGKSEVPGLSRITVVVDVEELPLEQVTKQLNKLINVIKIVELDPAQTVQREHMLIKVRVDNTTRSQILEAATLFRARIVDVATDALVIEVTGDTAKTQALLACSSPTASRRSRSPDCSPSAAAPRASPSASSRTDEQRQGETQ
jgi:acetolactate synthase small subunit